MLSAVTVGAIGVYQRHISPYKGFRCAYRALAGRWSCSEYARRIVLRLGPAVLLRALPHQFARCKTAYRALMAKAKAAPEPKRKATRRWSDYCDCSGCDPSGLLPHKATGCDAPMFCDAAPCDCAF